MQLRLAAAPLVVAALLAACSGAASSTPTAVPASAAPASAAPVAAMPSASAAASMAASAAPASAAASPSADSGGRYSKGSASPAPGGSGKLALAKTSLGTILVGPSGMTLYMFTPDSSKSSACTDSCAANWPPLTGAMPKLGTGLDAGDFGTLKRADGTSQVTFYGHPLYYFAGDQAAGDTNGQGLFGKWFALDKDGKAVK